MRSLTISQYHAFVAAVNDKPHDKTDLKNALRAFRFGAALVGPKGWHDSVPCTLREWKRDPVWAIAYVNAHQEACRKASDAFSDVFWKEFSSKIILRGLHENPAQEK